MLNKNMKKIDYLIKSFINAGSVFIYVSAVAWLGFNNQIIFGKTPSFLMPLFILLLFILSASITGLLVLGKPVHLYLGGFKKESIILLFSTLAWLVLFLLMLMATLSIYK